MLVTYTLFIISAFALFFRDRYLQISNNDCKNRYFFPGEIYYILFFFLLLTFYSFFSTNSIDQSSYINNFYNSSKTQLDFSRYFSGGALFLLISKKLSQQNISPFYFLLIFKLIFLLSLFYFCKTLWKRGDNPWIFLNYSCIGFFSVSMITNINQFASVSAMFYLLSSSKRNLVKEIVIGIAAMTLHRSGIIIILFFLLYHLITKINYLNFFKTLAIFIIILIFSYFFNPEFLNVYVVNYLNDYPHLNESKNGYLFRFAQIIPIFLIFYIFRNSYKKKLDKVMLDLINCAFIFILFLTILSLIFSTIADRLLVYFFPFIFIILSHIISVCNLHLKNKKNIAIFIIFLQLFFLNFWFIFSEHSKSHVNFTFDYPSSIFN
jgi:hypothetical protein